MTSHISTMLRQTLFNIPGYVVGTALVGVLMSFFSGALAVLPMPLSTSASGIPKVGAESAWSFERTEADLYWVLYSDMFAIQNLGHGAFLLMFATSWMRNGNILGLCMILLSSLFLLWVCVCYTTLIFLSIPTSVIGWLPRSSIMLFGLALSVALYMNLRSIKKAGFALFYVDTYVKPSPQRTFRISLLVQIVLRAGQLAVAMWWAYGRAISQKGQAMAQTQYDASLATRGFVETYTLGFHQAFVMASGMSQAFEPDWRKQNRSGILVFIFAQVMLVLVYCNGYLLANSDTDRIVAGLELLSSIFGCTSAHYNIICVDQKREIQSQQRASNTTSHMVNTTSGFNTSHMVNTSNAFGTSHVSNTSNTSNGYVSHPMENTSCVDGTNHILSTPNGYILNTPIERPHNLSNLIYFGGEIGRRASIVWWVVVFNALCWQAQCILLQFAELTNESPADHMVVSVQAGLNFGMHGAGISVFCSSLALYNRESWPFLRVAVMLGGLGGALMSVAQMYKLSHMMRNVELGMNETLAGVVWYFFACRAIAGISLAAVYPRLIIPVVDNCSETFSPIAQHDVDTGVELYTDDEKKRKKDNVNSNNNNNKPSASATQRNWLNDELKLIFEGRGLVCTFIYQVSILSFAWSVQRAAVVANMDVVGVGGHADSSMNAVTDLWAPWRLLSMPVSYGILFHFFFLLPGFALHGYITEFVPSIQIGKAFTASACLLATTQSCMLFGLTLSESHFKHFPESSINELGFASAGVAVGSAAMLVLLNGTCVNKGNKPKRTRVVKLGDFWH